METMDERYEKIKKETDAARIEQLKVLKSERKKINNIWQK